VPYERLDSSWLREAGRIDTSAAARGREGGVMRVEVLSVRGRASCDVRMSCRRTSIVGWIAV
jgi:hypothetical protein